MLALSKVALCSSGSILPDATLLVNDGRIQACGTADQVRIPAGAENLSMPGCTAFPGFIDLHTHGLLNADAFGSELVQVIPLLPRCGVTAFLATTVTLPMERVLARLQEMDRVLRDPPFGARCLGIHLEGSFLSPKRTGMANPAWCTELTPQIFGKLQEVSGGRIRMVTLAPEVGASMEMIPWLQEQGVIVSIGHSDATYEQAVQAIDLGARHATHTFNAMSPLHHRQPGVTGAILTHESVTAELIADGQHVHPAAMHLLFQAKGARAVCLVSDSAPFAGLDDGTYPWEGYTLVVKDGTCRLADGRLAGAHALLDTGFRTLVNSLGLPAATASCCTSEVPAHELGLQATKGSIRPGNDADIVLLNRDLQVQMTLVAGEIAWRR